MPIKKDWAEAVLYSRRPSFIVMRPTTRENKAMPTDIGNIYPAHLNASQCALNEDGGACAYRRGRSCVR